jgi:two-component system KDP operon response regulator KdpE
MTHTPLAGQNSETQPSGGGQRILVVDDDSSVAKLISDTLSRNGFDVQVAVDGLQALKFIEGRVPDLIILDIRMPKLDGYEVAVRVREWSQVPIIIVSALIGESEKIRLLDLGADDYLTKPFGPGELLARVRAVLRRTKNPDTCPVANPIVCAGEIEMDFSQRKVTLGGVEVKFTPTEFSLLQELANNMGKVLTYSYLLEHVWGPRYKNEKEYLHVFIGRLRRKLEPDHANPLYIINISGFGYQFKDPGV